MHEDSLGRDSFRFAGLAGWNPEGQVSRGELADHRHPTLLVWPSDDPFDDIRCPPLGIPQ